MNYTVALVEKIIAAKETPKLLPCNLVRGDTVAADTSGLEKQIDTLVYSLYNLTEEEIKIVEEQI